MRTTSASMTAPSPARSAAPVIAARASVCACDLACRRHLTIDRAHHLYPLQAGRMHQCGMLIAIKLDIVHVRNAAHDLVNTPVRALWNRYRCAHPNALAEQ